MAITLRGNGKRWNDSTGKVKDIQFWQEKTYKHKKGKWVLKEIKIVDEEKQEYSKINFESAE